MAGRTGTKGVARADREAQVLDAADLAFATRGYAGTSVAAIARRVGVTKPLLYQYFGAKDQLFAACLERATGDLVRAIEAVAAGDSVGLDRGLRTLAAVFDTLEPHPHRWRIVFDTTAPPDGPTGRALARYRDRVATLAVEGVTEMLVLAGDDDPLDADALAAVWLRIVDALVDWWLAHPDESAAAMTARSARLLSAVAAPR